MELIELKAQKKMDLVLKDIHSPYDIAKVSKSHCVK